MGSALHHYSKPMLSRDLLPSPCCHQGRRSLIVAACFATLAALGATTAPSAAGEGVSASAPNEVLVKYSPATPAGVREATARAAGSVDPMVVGARTTLLHLAPGVSVASALDRLRGR